MTGPVQSRLLSSWTDPATAFAALYSDAPYAFWLDAGPGARTGVSYLGAASPRSRFVTASVIEGTVTSVFPTDAAPPVVTQETVFEFLRRDLADDETSSLSGIEGFDLGWVGWLGYELGAHTVGTPVHESRYPDAALLEVDRMIRFDHDSRTVTLVASRGADDSSSADPSSVVTEWFDQTAAALAASPRGPAAARAAVPRASAASAHWRHDETEYAALIETCLAAIHDGDAYQLCLTNEIRVPGQWHPIETYGVLRAGSPSHHGGVLRFGDLALLSASPEQFLHVGRDRRVRTKPIKGTRPRSKEPGEDERLKVELAQSDKERAENLMIVDLMRNDLGRIAELGTVAVSSLLAVESYPHVHQLVSTIEALLSPGVTVVDAIQACFPAGSMTGAPKRSAMTILDALETGPRGVYSGAFGYIGHGGVADLAIVIRSIVLDSCWASIGTGGGITALSNAADEIEETRIKAAALLASLGVAWP
ncbi:anthranilate synthase component I family protein [Cryobacterium sp. TMT1-66-1]|uniref:anthranilate synthase component I family protein n=1 Tax=Cryobacterium sp. TMT1-66-1 TaxID=1259242 RepID=UPI00106D30C7|nr:anthranilate synthase component I family protein [Cryobacterium sp. TMT1-66-1]TFD03591.1 anthranilate synthase component I family protein [Cryobacterium sp. TMT1-66-1]